MAEKHRSSDSLAYVEARSNGEADAWSQEVGARGGQILAEVAEVEPPAEVASQLGLPAGEKAVVRRRIILLDEAPVELADSYYPLTLARGTGLAEKRKIKGGAPTLLAQLGHSPRHVSEDLTFRAADSAEREELGLPSGASVLTLLRATRSAEGVCYEVQLMTMKAPRSLHYEIEVD